MLVKNIIGLCLVASLTGCADLRGRPDLLAFIADGTTTKEQVLSTLGEPSSFFEGEKILTYRIGEANFGRGYFLVEYHPGDKTYAGWYDVKYSLVLVFNGQNVLQRHSLVEVRQ